MLKEMYAPNDVVKVLYHANCADGFTSAWVVRKYFMENHPNVPISYHACTYNQPVPTSLDKNTIVYMVDFCYLPEVMGAIFELALYTTVLDHHKSAIDRMDGFLYPNEDSHDVPYFFDFDIERSGAGITWDYFFRDKDRPWIVKYVEDRDLWRFTFKETRAVNANLFSFEYTFENWDNIALALEDNLMHDAFILAGQAIERKHFKDIREFLAFHTNYMTLAGYSVPVVSVPYCWSSDAGHLMIKEIAKGYIKPPFAAAFWFIKKEDGEPAVQFSLRSIGDFDVQEIAKKFNGGGHKNAAGFTVSLNTFENVILANIHTSDDLE